MIDFGAHYRARNRRVARRLYFETMHQRRRIPPLPHFGRAAAALVEAQGTLVMFLSPELDDVDVRIACYTLAMRLARFDQADAVRLSTLRDVRRIIERSADRDEILSTLV